MSGTEPADPILVILGALGFGAADRNPVMAPAAEVIEAIRRSKLPLATLQESDCPGLDWLFESSEYRELAAEHQRRREMYEQEFRSLLEETRRRDLPVIVIKSTGGFPYESSNLDLLVPANRMDEAAGMLTSLGFLHRHFRRGAAGIALTAPA